MVELFDAARALAVYMPARIEKVLVVLSVPELPKDAQEELRARLLPIAAVSNPVDLTGGGVDEHFGIALEVWLKYADAAVGAALIHHPGYGEKMADHILSAYKKFRKPVVVVSFGAPTQTKALEEKLRGRLVVVNTPGRAAEALSAVAFYGSKVYRRGGEGGYEHKGGQGVDGGVSAASGGVVPK